MCLFYVGYDDQTPEDTLPAPNLLFSVLNVSTTFSCDLVSGLLIRLHLNEERTENKLWFQIQLLVVGTSKCHQGFLS